MQPVDVGRYEPDTSLLQFVADTACTITGVTSVSVENNRVIVVWSSDYSRYPRTQTPHKRRRAIWQAVARFGLGGRLHIDDDFVSNVCILTIKGAH